MGHIDKKTGKERMIPPYTSPPEFFNMIEREEKETNKGEALNPNASSIKGQSSSLSSTSGTTAATSSGDDNNSKDYDETTYDGYQDILDANASDNREDELEAMRKARMKNRMKGGMPEFQKKE